MKFLLVPLLIIGMFVSFTAALIAMLFFTKTVQTPQDLVQLVLGGPDSTKVFDEFLQKEDRLDDLFQLAEEYKTRYEEQAKLSEAIQESLVVEKTKLQTKEDSLNLREKELGLIADTVYQQRQEDRLQDLAKYYAKIKPQQAAEILQQESELSDTLVARLMGKLPASQMAKIMGNMNPDFAARITKLMKDLTL